MYAQNLFLNQFSVLTVAGLTDYRLTKLEDDMLLHLKQISVQNLDSAASFITLRFRWYTQVYQIATISLILVDTVYPLLVDCLLPEGATLEIGFTGGAAGDTLEIFLYGRNIPNVQ
jgi:hypothetical protein